MPSLGALTLKPCLSRSPLLPLRTSADKYQKLQPMLRTNLQQVGSQYWKQLSLLGKQVRMTYQGEQSMASLKCRQMRRRKSPGQISSKGRPAASWHWLYVGESRPPGLRLVREVSGRDLTKSGGLLGDRSHLPRSVPAEAKILERACSFFSVSFSIKRLSYK